MSGCATGNPYHQAYSKQDRTSPTKSWVSPTLRSSFLVESTHRPLEDGTLSEPHHRVATGGSWFAVSSPRPHCRTSSLRPQYWRWRPMRIPAEGWQSVRDANQAVLLAKNVFKRYSSTHVHYIHIVLIRLNRAALVDRTEHATHGGDTAGASPRPRQSWSV